MISVLANEPGQICYPRVGRSSYEQLGKYTGDDIHNLMAYLQTLR